MPNDSTDSAVSSTPVAPSSPDDRAWSLAAHLGPVFVSIVAPLVVLLLRGRDSQFVRTHAVEAINFQLTILIASACCIPLLFVLVGIPLLLAVSTAWLVLGVVAGVRAFEGRAFRYPLTIRFLK